MNEEKVSRKNNIAAGIILGFTIGVIIWLFILNNSTGNNDSVPIQTLPTVSTDIMAQDACVHFRNVIRDATNGLLDNVQIRAKFQEVYASAEISTSPGIAQYAADILKANTFGSVSDETVAFMHFSYACSALGFN